MKYNTSQTDSPCRVDPYKILMTGKKLILAAISLVVIAVTYVHFTKNDIRISNGWLIHNGKAIWGYGQYSAMYRAGRRPNITRNSPGNVGPNRTEDLGELADNMVRFGYPALVHQFGLWYDRRRDVHDKECRTDDEVVPPFLEQPWARSDQGRACDGLPLYELSKFNDWYFSRLQEFAHQADQKGVILYHNYFIQHALLEFQTHYVDHPFRPGNSLNATKMPQEVPAAFHFYNLDYPGKVELFKRYIRRVLDEIGEYENVIHFTGEEFTGPFEFVEFWMDQILEWEREQEGRDVKIGLSAPKNSLDQILGNPDRAPHVDAIDLRYFWYRKADGTMFAPWGGSQIPGRYYVGTKLEESSSPELVYRQTMEYREKFPNKIIFHSLGLSLEFQLAFLMAGGSINIAKILYGKPNAPEPPDYILPRDLEKFQPTLNFIRNNLENDLALMVPKPEVGNPDKAVYVLASDRKILVYSLNGGTVRLNMIDFEGQYTATWFNPDTGETSELPGTVSGSGEVELITPDLAGWLLLLERQ